MEQALSLFRKFIRSDAQSQKVIKKRKLDPDVTKNEDGTVSLGRNSNGHIPGPAKEKAVETTQVCPSNLRLSLWEEVQYQYLSCRAPIWHVKARKITCSPAGPGSLGKLRLSTTTWLCVMPWM